MSKSVLNPKLSRPLTWRSYVAYLAVTHVQISDPAVIAQGRHQIHHPHVTCVRFTVYDSVIPRWLQRDAATFVMTTSPTLQLMVHDLWREVKVLWREVKVYSHLWREVKIS